MGREINRVPLDFDWPIGRTWLAYDVRVEFPQCWVCDGDGYSAEAKEEKKTMPRMSDWYPRLKTILAERGQPVDCPRCDGHGTIATDELRAWEEAMPSTPLPEGEGWQLWETVSDSPMSPVFATASELVDWMTSHPWRLNTGPGASLVPADRATAEAFVAAGWAPSIVITNGVAQDGVAAVVSDWGQR